MKPFLDDDFLLDSESARRLYHEYAEREPILDFHCHLPPAEIAADGRFPTLAHAWLGGDHYKWRLMRANGIPEELVTGGEPGYERFLAWARTVPRIVGNPLHHWTHLELRRYFGVTELLDERTAPAVWEACNARLAEEGYGARGLLVRMGVHAVCTTDDPADDLRWHRDYAATRRPGEPLMVPTFRPDRYLAVESPKGWNAALDALGAVWGRPIEKLRDLIEALGERHAAFHEAGCRASDHALASVPATFLPASELEAAFAELRAGALLPSRALEGLKTALLLEVGRMDAARGWAMQLHLGSIRNLNARMFERLGADSGFDAAGEAQSPRALAAFLDSLEREGRLPKTVLYTINPVDYEPLVTVMGCFQDGSLPGKMQLGSAWWFNDHIEGMRRQLLALANNGLLSRFIGMLTDSRSFLSFPRHEYFRRILCGLVGGWMEAGEAPSDLAETGALVRAVCYENARGYFALPGLEA